LGIQGLAWRTQSFVDDGWRFHGSNSACRFAHQPLLLVFAALAGFARAFTRTFAAHHRFSSLRWMRWHSSQDQFGHRVSFGFERVSR
jgi:hypothetical protein